MTSPNSQTSRSLVSRSLGFMMGAGGAYGLLWFYELDHNLGLVGGACLGLGLLGAYLGPAIVHLVFELF